MTRRRKPDWAALWDDLHYKGRRNTLRAFLCDLGLHWRIVFDYEATPAYLGEDPTPPEAGWCCNYCGKLREPYTWALRERTIWRLKAWWYERMEARHVQQ